MENKEENKNKEKKIKFDIKKFLGDNRKTLIVAGVALLIVAVLIVVIALCFSDRSNEKKLKAKMEDMGVAFYEKYYYDSLKNTFKDDDKFVEKLTQFKDKGIHISLDNLSRISIKEDNGDVRKFSDEMKEFVNSETNKACDLNESEVIILPKEKYGKKDYTIKVELSCGFEENKK